MRIADILGPTLLEAPIGNLEVHGDMHHPGSFAMATDRKLLNNPRHLAKIRYKFERSPFLFNLYFCNLPNKDYLAPVDYDEETDDEIIGLSPEFENDAAQHEGFRSPAAVKALTGLSITPDPRAITLIFVSNINLDNHVPLTPWMVAHRFAHVLLDKSLDQTAAQSFSIMLRKVPSHLMTFRSARTGSLGIGEEAPELVAQYCLTGRITLRLSPDRLSLFIANGQTEAEVNRNLGKIEATLTNAVKSMLTASLGHLIVVF